jgi:hypothetical protein
MTMKNICLFMLRDGMDDMERFSTIPQVVSRCRKSFCVVTHDRINATGNTNATCGVGGNVKVQIRKARPFRAGLSLS